jgi:hypothetical protein
MSDTVSADSIKAQMPHAILTRVLGKPTHKQVKMVIRELTANLMAISCPWGHNKGHLGLLQDPAIYLANNGAVFTIPAAEPPMYPVIPVGTNVQQREELRAINIAARKAWATYRLILAITRDQFAAAINNIYYAALNDPTEGLNGVNLRTLVQHILTTYAQISQPDLDNNMAEFNIGIDSGCDNSANLTVRQEGSPKSALPELDFSSINFPNASTDSECFLAFKCEKSPSYADEQTDDPNATTTC